MSRYVCCSEVVFCLFFMYFSLWLHYTDQVLKFWKITYLLNDRTSCLQSTQNNDTAFVIYISSLHLCKTNQMNLTKQKDIHNHNDNSYNWEKVIGSNVKKVSSLGNKKFRTDEYKPLYVITGIMWSMSEMSAQKIFKSHYTTNIANQLINKIKSFSV